MNNKHGSRLRVGKLPVLSVVLVLFGCVTVSEPRKSGEEVALQYVQLAAGYYQRGDLELAIGQLNKAVVNNPNSYEAAAMLALVNDRLEKYAVAEEYYVKAIALAKDDSHEWGAARNNYGAFLCRRDRAEDSIRQFDSAVSGKLYQTPEVAYENAGVCLLKLNDELRAESYFVKAATIRPNLSRSLWELAKLNYKKGEQLKARAFLQRFHDQGDRNPESLVLGVRIEKSFGNTVLLNRYVQELKEKFPDSAQAKQAMEIVSSN